MRPVDVVLPVRMRRSVWRLEPGRVARGDLVNDQPVRAPGSQEATTRDPPYGCGDAAARSRGANDMTTDADLVEVIRVLAHLMDEHTARSDAALSRRSREAQAELSERRQREHEESLQRLRQKRHTRALQAAERQARRAAMQGSEAAAARRAAAEHAQHLRQLLEDQRDLVELRLSGRPTVGPVRDDGLVDEVAVERACAGDPVALTLPERVEAAVRMSRVGVAHSTIAARAGVSTRTVERWLSSARRGSTQAVAS